MLKNRSIDLIRNNHYLGKLGEYYASIYIYKNNNCNKFCEPDIKIYNENQRTHDADLMYNGENYHVKTCNEKTARLYQMSWCFQLHNSYQDNDNIVFVYIDEQKDIYEIKGIYKYKDVKKLFKYAGKASMKGKKHYSYAKDL